MTVTAGPNLGLMIDAADGDAFGPQFRGFLRAIDAVLLGAVISRTLTAPPGSPANGDRYVVAAAPTGAWAGKAGNITVWTTDNPATPGGLWEFYPPKAGWTVFSIADGALISYAAGVWALAASGSVVSVAGRTGAIVLAEADITGLVADLAATEKTANKGVASGYASLDGTGHVPLSQIPAGLVGALQYQGVWDASANSPALASGVGTKGFFYKVSAAGATTLDGATGWHIGDLAIFDGTVWDKVDNYEAVTSVAGRTGAVVLAEADVTGLVADLALLAPKASPALTGAPTAPTPGALDNSTKLATTAYADVAVGVEKTRALAAEATTEKTANKGAASGYAPLDAGSLVPLANLPLSYDIGVFNPGVGAAAQIVLRLPMVRACTFPSGAANSVGKAGTAATASTTFTYKKNGTAFATAVFAAAGSTATWTQASAAVFAAGDVLEIDGPGTADATLADFGLTLYGVRS